MNSVRVRVPATTANLGPGFDTLGLALQFYNCVTVEQSASECDEIIALGEGESILNAGPVGKNIALRAARELFDALSIDSGPIRLTAQNAIPLARGLGSSSAARVGALVAANEWSRMRFGKSADKSTLLALATRLEGHPDNVAPALFGGLVVSAMGENGEVFSARVGEAKFPRLVVFIPDTELETKAARAVLPESVSMRDATFNISRASLMVAALAIGDWDLLREATRDRLHQSQRATLMPAYDSVVRAAIESGAYGATLSGAGPCILAWLPEESTLVASAMAAMQSAAHDMCVGGKAIEVAVDTEGCVVVG